MANAVLAATTVGSWQLAVIIADVGIRIADLIRNQQSEIRNNHNCDIIRLT
jgi:hypothetical protein